MRSTVTDDVAYLINLQALISQEFALEDLRARSAATGLDQERLGGMDKADLARSLILALAKDGRLSELILLAQRHYPGVDWPGVPDGFTLPESWPVAKTVGTVTASRSGDLIRGDKITVGEIKHGGAVAIGSGARAEINQYMEIIVRVDTLEDLPPAPGEPPFKGLTYFTEKDADIFFGREELTRRLVARLTHTRFQAVVGASGSGKSSVLRAGVVPALRRQNWLIHIITPTADPLGQLASTLTRDDIALTAAHSVRDALIQDPDTLHLAARKLTNRQGANQLLLLIDQFEELFTLSGDESERQAFLENLQVAAAAQGPTTVLIGLRADFYDRCLRYEALRTVLAEHQEPIGPMSQEELVRAIAEPARRGYWQFVEGLVEQILEDVGTEPGRLPLLSHALLETWGRRRGTVMTLAGYRDAGGVEGAIARTAEETLAQLPESQVVTAKRIFLALTELGEGAEDTRRIASRAELRPQGVERGEVERVLERLVDARLVMIDGDHVEVAHEALIRRWPRLREWLEDNRERLRFERLLAQDAREWHALERDQGALYRGARLAQAIEWLDSREQNAVPLEKEFLVASRELAEREAREKDVQRQRELAQQQALADAQRKRAEEAEAASVKLKRRRNLALGLAAGALVLAAIALLLFQKSNQNAARAEAEATRALNAENHVRSRLLFTQGEYEWENNPLLGMQLVLESLSSVIDSNKMQDSAAEMSEQLVSLGRSGRVFKVGSGVKQLFLSPVAGILVTSYLDGSPSILHRSFAETSVITLSGTELSRVSFSQDGSLAGIVYADEGVPSEVRRTEDGAVVCTFEGQTPNLGVALSISPGGRYILVEKMHWSTMAWLETAVFDMNCALIEEYGSASVRFLADHDDVLVPFNDDSHYYMIGGGGTPVTGIVPGMPGYLADVSARNVIEYEFEGATIVLPENVEINSSDRLFFSQSGKVVAVKQSDGDGSQDRARYEIREVSDGRPLFEFLATSHGVPVFNPFDSAVAIIDPSNRDFHLSPLPGEPSCDLGADDILRDVPFYPPEVYRAPDGEKLESITEDAMCVRFTPGVATVSVAYHDRVDILSLDDASLLATYSDAIDLDDLVFNAPGNVGWAKFERGSAVLWDMQTGTTLVDLGVGLGDDSGFDGTGRYFFAHYLDGRTYMIDVDFLKDMLAIAADSPAEILSLTCRMLTEYDYLLEPERLRPFLDDRVPQACP